MPIGSDEAIAAAVASVRAGADVRASAWRVNRLDRPGEFYYLVSIETKGGEASIVVMDGQSGAVDSSARVQSVQSAAPMPPDRAARLADLYPAEEIDLVWMPCNASRSPLYPLWRVRSGEDLRYIDQSGVVFKELRTDMRGG